MVLVGTLHEDISKAPFYVTSRQSPLGLALLIVDVDLPCPPAIDL